MTQKKHVPRRRAQDLLQWRDRCLTRCLQWGLLRKCHFDAVVFYVRNGIYDDIWRGFRASILILISISRPKTNEIDEAATRMIKKNKRDAEYRLQRCKSYSQYFGILYSNSLEYPTNASPLSKSFDETEVEKTDSQTGRVRDGSKVVKSHSVLFLPRVSGAPSHHRTLLDQSTPC